jgi:hypothetical protein
MQIEMLALGHQLEDVPGESHRANQAADFFVLPTVTYRVLFVLVILAHERRRCSLPQCVQRLT